MKKIGLIVILALLGAIAGFAQDPFDHAVLMLIEKMTAERVAFSGGHLKAGESKSHPFSLGHRRITAIVFFDGNTTSLGTCIRWSPNGLLPIGECAESDPASAPLIVSTSGQFAEKVEVEVEMKGCSHPTGCSYAVAVVGGPET